MSENEINQVIAEACGWVPHFNGHWYKLKDPQADMIDWTNNEGVLHHPPNYCQDLNAMHEAEKMLTNYKWPIYTTEIRRIIQRDCDTEAHYLPDCTVAYIADFWFFHATARQRAEAFLRTLNRWKD